MAERKLKKQDDRTLVVTVDGVDYRYTPDFLRRQRRAIIAQRDREAEQRAAELAEVDELLAACARLGVTGRGTARTATVPLERLGVYAADMAHEVEPAPRPTFWQSVRSFFRRGAE